MSEKQPDIQQEIKKEISAVDFLDRIIFDACNISASDIHIDPRGDFLHIHFRLNGDIIPYSEKPLVVHQELIGRLKVLSKLRSDIHDKGQDGRFEFLFNKERIDVRVSILPTFHGENAVLRILRPEKSKETSFIQLGMTNTQSGDLQDILEAQKGIIIVAGPTGSGKTTTIYSIIKFLLSKDLYSIVTLEDPVEYLIDGIRQIQISESIDFGFSKALRSVLRQDPDIIVIGEIRDADTASLAFQASRTGHLVIASIHTEDSASVCHRLRDLGVTSQSLHDLSAIISQRLVPDKNHSRVGVFEVIKMNASIKSLVLQKYFPEYIRQTLRKNGAKLLRDRADELVLAGTLDDTYLKFFP